MAVAAFPRSTRRPAASGFRTPRILTAVPICDGHDSAITTVNVELVRRGAEIIYLGYHCPASSIARAAVQEDVDAIGISSYNGGHIGFFREVRRQLRARGAGELPIFGGGGGTITPADARVMARDGVDRIFFAGTPLDEMTRLVVERYGGSRKKASKPAARRGISPSFAADLALARAISLLEMNPRSAPAPSKRGPRGGTPGRKRAFVVGVAGPGGVGKSTLIDELTARFLGSRSEGRLAILANDPSHPESGGAILGDRVSAVYSQDDRVFFRSLATRGHPSGLSSIAPRAIDRLAASGEFDFVFVESIGIGQESDPFGVFGRRRLADLVVFVLAPHYGGRIQLQKTALLDGADMIALNKCDHPAAHAAKAEIAERLRSGKRPAFHATVAANHRDPGIDELYAEIERRAGGPPENGRR